MGNKGSGIYAVIGLGHFGSAIARKLSEKGVQVIAFDNNPSHINDIKDEVSMAVCLDATDKKAMIAQGIKDAEAVVVAIGENFEALLLCTVHLIDLEVKRVIARADGIQQRTILQKIGVEEILSPEVEVANSVAEQLLNPSIVSFLHLPDDYEIIELKAPKGIHNKTIEEISLRNKYRMNLVTIKRIFDETKDGEIVKEEHVLGVPKSETVIYDTDTIVVFGKIGDIERFQELNV